MWADRTRADGRYLIIGVDGSEFIVTDGRGIYKTGQQIVTEHLSTAAGASATTQTVTVTFSDEEPIAKLQQLMTSYPNALIYLMGAIVVDLPEEIKLTSQPKQFQTVSLTGSTLNFTFYPLEQAILQLRGQYIVGTLTVKAIQSKPVL